MRNGFLNSPFLGDRLGICQPRRSYKNYNFYCDFKPGVTPVDKVSKQLMQTTGLAAGRVSYEGGPYGVNKPAVDENGLFGCGAFTQYAITNTTLSSWSKVDDPIITTNINDPIGGTNAFHLNLPIGQGGNPLMGSRVYRAMGDNTGIRSFSFWAKAASEGTFPVAYFDGANYQKIYVQLTTSWKLFMLEIPIASESFLSFSRRGDTELETLTEVDIYLPTVTNTTYGLPPVINTTTSALAIPENYSDADQGYKFSINDMPQLLGALDGVADGEELWNNPTVETGWTDNGDGTYTCDGTTDAVVNIGKVSDGSYLSIKFDILDQTSGSVFAIVNGTSSGISKSDQGSYEQRILDTSNFYKTGIRSSNFIGTIRPTSIKQISTAKGKLLVKGWRPMFDYDQIPSGNTQGLLSIQSTLYSILYYGGSVSQPGDNYTQSFDGTNSVNYIGTNWQADTPYDVTLQYGPHPDYVDDLKMQLTVTDGTTIWQSSVVDFDGSFDPDEFLSFFWDNEYPQYIKHISIKKEPEW